MPPKMPQTPTQQLQKIRMSLKDTRKWMKKVTDLIALGADPLVLDNYTGWMSGMPAMSIIKCYILAGIGAGELMALVKFLLDIGVTPTNEVFVSCFNLDSYYGPQVAELVMVASGNTIDVNELDFYGVPASTWAMRVLIKRGRYDDSVKYLMSKGLRTDTKNISIDDILVAHDKPNAC